MFGSRLRISEMRGHFERVSVQFQGTAEKKWPLAEKGEESGPHTWICVTGWLEGSKGGSADREQDPELTGWRADGDRAKPVSAAQGGCPGPRGSPAEGTPGPGSRGGQQHPGMPSRNHGRKLGL